MELSTILISIFQIFANSPDLCAEVYRDPTGAPWTDSIGQTLSRYCQWTGPNPPTLDANVCCDIAEGVAACVSPDVNGRCSFGAKYYCKYGQATTAGIVCYQPFPDACEAGHCVAMPELPPPTQANLLCCNTGACQEIKVDPSMEDCEDNGGIL
jgi:hypothetical protein